MKTRLMAAMCASLASGGAFAQNSVTIYGLIDAGVSHVTNIGGSSTNLLDTGAMQANRFGLRGVEDLGGGWSALFNLENGFSLDTGTASQGGALFGRTATVGLASPHATVTAGRQVDFFNSYLSRYSNAVNNGSGQAYHLGGYDRVPGVRFNNSVRMETRSIGGLRMGAMYSFGEAASSSTNRGWALGARYDKGPLSMGAAYSSANDGSITPAREAGIGSLFSAPTTAAGAPLTIALDRTQVIGAGASYALGKLTLRGSASTVRFARAGDSARLNAYEVGVNYQASGNVMLMGGYTRQKLADNGWNTFTASAAYAFSKRTDAYVVSNYMRASGDNVVATLLAGSPSSNKEQAVLRVGVRHKF